MEGGKAKNIARPWLSSAAGAKTCVWSIIMCVVDDVG
jgi:hypothetical protein